MCLVSEGLQKTTLHECRDSRDFSVNFADFWYPGTNFHDFDRPGDGLEFRWSFMAALRHPQILRPAWWKGTQWFLALDSMTLEADT